MRFLSLFSGIDAASVAFQPLGWKAAGFCEIDPFACAVLKHRYPSVPNLGDVEKADVHAIGPVDLIIFGSPCQSFSIAGRRLGLDDPRGNMALIGAQAVYRKRPRWFVFENVPGLFSSDCGWDFGTLAAALAGYPPGSVFEPPADGWRNSGIIRQAGPDAYGLAWRVLDAQYVRVDGLERAVPQRRRRVFIVGYLGDWRPAAAVLFERESVCWNHPPSRASREGITHDISPSVGASGRGFERAGETRGQDPVVAVPLASRGNETGGTRPPGTDADTAENLIVAGPVSSKWSKRTGGPAGDECYNLVADPVQANEGRTYSLAGNNPRPRNVTEVMNGTAVRRLTPRECERLQGLPDDWTLVPYRGKPAADGNRYKVLGNSFAVNCIRWIGRRIEAVDKPISPGSGAFDKA